MSDELIQRVLKVIATSKRIPLETVTIDSDFEELGIDSMDAVEILFALENEFDISIPDDEVRSVRNVRQMCEGVERLVAAKAAARAGRPSKRCGASPSPAWAPSARWAGTPRSSPSRCAQGRSGIGPIESTDMLAVALSERRRGARLQPPAVLRRPPRRFHGPLRAVRRDRRARSRGRRRHRVDAGAARDRRHHHRLLRGRPEHRRHRLPGGLQAGPQPRASADHSQDHGQRRRQPHLHGVRHHRPQLHHFHGLLLGGPRHRPGVLDGALAA